MGSQSSNFEGNFSHNTPSLELELLLNNANDFIVLLDSNNIIKFANNAYKSHIFKTQNIEIEHHKTSFLSLVPSFLQSHYRDILQNVLIEGTIKNETFRNYPITNLPDAYWEETFKCIKNDSNRVESISIFIKEITQQYRAQLELQENEAILKGVFESSIDEIISINTKYEVTSFNSLVASCLEQEVGKKIKLGINIVHYFEKNGFPHWANVFKRRFERALSGEQFTEMEALEVGGEMRYKEISINPIRINDTIIGISIFGRNVTQRVFAEKKFLENDAFLKTVQDLAQIGTWRHNLKSGEFTCSNYCFEIFGTMPTSKPSKELFEAILGYQNVQQIQISISDFLKTGRKKIFEINLELSVNQKKNLTCLVNPIVSEKGELIEIICVFQDVTNLKKTAEELDKANEFLNTILNSTDYAIITTDKDGITTSFNSAAEKMLGFKASEIVNIHSPLLWHEQPEVQSLADKLSIELGRKIEPNFDIFRVKSQIGLKNEIECTVIKKDNTKLPVQISISPIYDSQKTLTGYVGLIRDFSERILVENKLKEQNALLNAVINSLPFDFWVRDQNQKMVFQNPASKDFWGTSLVGEFEHQDIPADILSHWKENNQRAYQGEIVRGETIFNFNGKRVFIDEIVSPIFDENKQVTGILGINIDINDRKRIETKLIESYEEEIKLNKELANREEELTTKEEELRQSLEELISVNDFIALRERQISAVFDNSPDIIASIDKNLRINIANQAFKNVYFKIHHKEYEAGTHLRSFFLDESIWKKYEPIYYRVLKGEIISQITDLNESLFGRYVSEEYYAPIKNDHNEITGVAIFIKDITEKVIAEENSRKVEKIFNEVINSSPDLISYMDRNYTFQAMNKSAIEFIKKTRNLEVEIGKSTIFDLVRNELIEQYLDGYKTAFTGKANMKEVCRATSDKDRPYIYTNEYFHPVYDENNEILGVANFVKDVTEQTIAEQKSTAFQQKFSAILNSTTDYILLINKDLSIGVANQLYIDRLKNYYNIEIEFDKTNAYETLPSHFHEKYSEIFDKVLKGSSHVEIFKRTYHNSVEIFYSEEHFFPILDDKYDVIGISVFARDITESILNQQLIKENELKFRLIADTTNDASYDHNLLDDSISWFGGFEELYQIDRNSQKFDVKIWSNSIHPEDKDRVLESYHNALTDHSATSWKEEYRIIDQKGDVKHVIDKASFIKDDQGKTTRSLGGMQDITKLKFQEEKIKNALAEERKLNEELAQREEELTANEEQLRLAIEELTYLNTKISEKEKQLKAIINSTNDFILLINKDFKVEFFNNSYRDRVRLSYNKEIKEGDDIFNFMREEEKTIYKNINSEIFTGKVVKFENYIKETDVYREEYFNPILSENGEILAYAAFIRDVTEKVKVQKKIEASEAMLNETQELAKLGSWRYNIDNQKLTWSNCIYSIYEIDPTTKITFDFFKSLYESESKKPILDTILSAIENKSSYKIEEKFIAKDGSIKFLVGIGNPVFDNSGNLIEYIGSVQDISDRKKIELSLANSLIESQKLNETLGLREQELRANQEKLKSYVNELSLLNKKLEEKEVFLNKNIQLLNLTGMVNKVGGWEYDVIENKYYLTDQMYLMRGLKVGDNLTFENTINFYSPEDGQLLKEKFADLIEKGDPYDHEMQMKTASGKKIWIRSVGYAELENSKTIRAYGAVQDITKRKLDQQKLEESEANLKAIINNTDFSIWAINKDYKFIAFNEEFAKRFKTQQKIDVREGMDAFTGTNENHFSLWKQLYERALNGEKFNTELEMGNSFIEYYFNPIINADGSIRGIAIIGNDVTQKKNIEKKIKSSEEKFRALFEKSKVSMMLIDSSNVIDCNSYTLELLQLNNKDELNEIMQPLLKTPNIESFSLTKHNNTNKVITSYQEKVFDWTHIKKDGNKVFGEIRITPIQLDGKEVLFSQFYNLTERKVAENKLMESENFLNSIIDNIPIGMMIIDAEGEVQRMNSAMLTLTSIPHNWYSRGGINFINDEFLNKTGATSLYKIAQDGGIVINEELEIDFGLSVNAWGMRNDAAWFMVTAFPIFENTKVKNVVIALIDITADKQNEEKIKTNAKELVESGKKMAEYKLMALRSVMNPHFLFNSLNSIQYFIAKNEREQALNYLSLFSKLIRSILNSSIDNSHSLAEEISILRFYIDLETLRFENKFKTIFEIDEELDIDSIEIPSLILQPYVENAILHGLYNKEGDNGVLRLSFKLTEDQKLLAEIEDNGIGRTEAIEIKHASKMHRSVGMLVTQERLELINKDNNLSVKIIDLKDIGGKPSGTKVEVIINI